MWHEAQSYIKFLLKSTNEHGVHSPFVFDLVTKCFYDNTDFADYKRLKKYRFSLLENKNSIEVTDFGAGSKIFKSNSREISQIAKTAGISEKRAELLFRITRYFQPETILEIGTSLGLATSALAAGNENSKIISLEGCPQTAVIAKESFAAAGITNAEFIVTEFQVYLEEVSKSKLKFDLIYFDGNHQKEATLHYFDLLLSTVKDNTVWIFDDIHWSAEMSAAWEIIKKNPQVTVTIDTFQWGFVFFRKCQVREDFTIRI